VQRRSREQSPPDLHKLLQQAEKHQEELALVQETVKRLMDKHSLLLDSLRKMSGAS
jgi:hypothetical protein